MRQIVADVTKYTSAVYSSRNIPIVRENRMCQIPEWSCKNNEESRRHDQSVFIHWEIVVDTVEQEMQGEKPSIVWQITSEKSELITPLV